MNTLPNHQRKVERELCIDSEVREADYTADKCFGWIEHKTGSAHPV